MSDEHSEGNRASRFSAGLPASMQLDGREHPCRAHNLSRTGVLLIGEIPLPDVTEIRFTVASASGDLRIATEARVVHVEKNPDGSGNCVGLEFGEFNENDRGTLESLVSRIVEGMAPAFLENLPEKATTAEIRAALEGVPLAHRIALAKRGQRKHRELLLQDPHLQVIDALVRSPNLLLHEVVIVLRMPNILPHTLAAIAKDARWKSNERARILIATHRNTPLAAAEEVVSGLPPRAVQKVLEAPGLPPALKSKLLRRK